MQIKSIFKRIVLLVSIAVFSDFGARAADESYIQTLSGKIKKGDTCSVTDDKFLNLPLEQWNRINNLSVDNIISFGMRRDTAFFFYKKTFTCTLKISVQYFNSRDQLTPSEIKDIELIVKYDSAGGAHFPAEARHAFKNAYKVVITVNSITSPEWGDKLPSIFIVKNQILVKRKYPFSSMIKAGFNLTNEKPSITTGQTQQRIAGTLNSGAGSLEISWDPADFPGAEEFDLEYTFIDKLSARGAAIITTYGGPTGPFTIPESVMEQWMRNDNTRVTVSNQNYTINLPYEEGYILARVRGVAYQVTTNLRLTTNWQYTDDNYDAACIAVGAHHPNITWQYTASFAEEGKRGEVISYFDCSLRSRQTVTINNSDNKAITAETIYDVMGRPTLSILPSPVIDPSTINATHPLFDNKLKFYGAVNKNGSSQPYSYSDITLAGTNCNSAAAALLNADGAGRYYSNNNPYIDVNHPEYADFYFTKYVPDADGYPFALTEYTPDNTGRIRRQGGVGSTFQIGEGHETQYFYGKPMQTELDRLFGVEAGNSSHYLKNMVVDPNGQISVSYIDASGKTVATALAGASPENLDPLESAQSTSAQWHFDELLMKPADFNTDPARLIKQASATFMAAVTGTFEVHYSVNPAALLTQHGGSLSFCSNCYYKIKVEVKNDCSETVASVSTTAFQMNDYTCYVSPTVFTATLNVPVNKIGEYTVTYTLQMDEDQVKTQTDYYIENNTDLHTIQNFFETELLLADLKGCYTDCESCKDNLGTLQEFTDRMEALLLKLKNEKYAAYPNFDINSTAITTWINNVYYELYDQCTQNCETVSPCEEKLTMLKYDVRPGGQYALYTYNSTTGTYAYIERDISVLQFFDDNITEINNLAYEDDNGNIVHIKEGGVYISESEFIRQYLNHPEWADEFVKQHKEYCSYLWCITVSTHPESTCSIEDSYLFDQKLRSINKGQTAIDQGYFSTANNFYLLLNADPFFKSECKLGDEYYDEMEADLLNASDILHMTFLDGQGNSVGVKDIDGLVNWLVYCKPTDPAATSNDFINSWTNCSVSSQCRSLTAEWEMLRDYYLQFKAKYLHLRKKDLFPECDNCFIGDDAFGQAGCVPPGPFGDYTLSEVNSEYFIVYKNETMNFPADYYIKISYEVDGILFTTTVLATSTVTKTLFYDGPGVVGNVEILSITCMNPCPSSSSCKDDPLYEYYKDKVRVFDEFTDVQSYLDCMSGNGPPYATQTESTDALRAEAIYLLSLEKDSWTERLKAIRDEENFSITDIDIDAIVDELFQLAKKYIEIAPDNDIRPASSLPTGQFSNGYNNFYEIFSAFAGGEFSKGFGPELLDGPYTHDRAPLVSNQATSEINADVCQRVNDLYSYFQTNVGGSLQDFHNWLEVQLKDDYMLTYAQLYDLYTRCGQGCRLLEEPINLPTVFSVPVPDNPDHPLVGCDRISDLTADFWNIYPDVTPDTKLYEHLYTRFLNFKLGYSLTYDDYIKCDTDPNTLLFNTPSSSSPKYDNFSCVANIMAGVFERAGQEYENYITIKRREFRNNYVSTCLSNTAKANLEGDQYEYHYTLYYYDQSGNLVKTIPPEGVSLLTDPQLSLVEDYRNNSCVQQNNGTLELNSSTPTGYAGHSLNVVSNTFTIEFWANPQSEQDTQPESTSGSAGENGQKYAIFPSFYSAVLNKAGVGVSVGTNGISVYEHAAAYLAPLLSWSGTISGWTHIAVVYINKKPRLYVNGELVKIGLTSTKGTVVPSYNFTGHPYGVMNGSLDEIRIWNVARTEEQINEYKSTGVSPTAPGLKAYWPMSTTDGSSAIDVTGNGYHSSLPNSNWSWSTNNSPATGPVSQSSNCFIVPDHGLATTYQYNSLNQVTRQTSPDGGTSKFWYDRLGRLVVSQNAEQRTPYAVDEDNPENRYSYTRYDALGRITEVGEKVNAAFMLEEIAKDHSLLQQWLNDVNSTNRQVTVTAYDEVPTWAPSSLTGLQHNLRKRVTATALLASAASPANPANNRTAASYYSYDIIGNVDHLVQENADLVATEQNYITGGTGLKHIQYEYDLVSGKVNKVLYQDGKWDQFYYQYLYDANNRLVKALTSRQDYSDANLWIPEALYRYYLHGPLARTELGINKVQGLDYGYTLQGWLKGVNGICLDPTKDMGGDANQELDWFKAFGRDAFAFSLGYHSNDYLSIGDGTGTSDAFKYTYYAPSPASGQSGMELFNGNISHAMYAISMLDGGMPTGQSYYYDQLNRIKGMDFHCLTDVCETREWSGSNMIDTYREQISYDANGNILSYNRMGREPEVPLCDNNPREMDDMSYEYNRDGNGRLINNRLRKVADNIDQNNFTIDIDDQNDDNYTYDNIGNLITDQAEGIDRINWTVYGKIKKIVKTSGFDIDYAYDVSGNRISKRVIGDETKASYYVRDAQGNVLGVYQLDESKSIYAWQEQHLYGSSRLGMGKPEFAIDANSPIGTDEFEQAGDAFNNGLEGLRIYELTNHLGNVLVTISDVKTIDPNGMPTPTIVTANDYYPFGMVMPGRSYAAGTGYRYGFNGKENDNEVKGEGNQQDYGMRIYDPRLGKFLSVDPLSQSYPWYTPYQFAGNKPIRFIDRDGAEEDDPDKMLDSKVPLLKQTFKQNILALPVDQQAAMRKNVTHAFNKRAQFSNYLVYRWLSTRLMTRWMGGEGGYDILSYKTLRNQSYLSWLKFDRRRDAITNDIKEQTLDYAKTLKEGTHAFSSYSQRDVGQGPASLTDIGTGLGSYKLLANGNSHISVGNSGDLTVVLTISYTLADKYQWKKGKGVAFEEFVDHDKMLELEKIGAKPFYIRVYFEATFRYENGKFIQVSDFRDSRDDLFYQLDENGNYHRGKLLNPEPRKGNGYAIPQDENIKIHDHRGE
jgi:RHS repeat-associated protein